MIGYFTFHAFAPCIKCTVNAFLYCECLLDNVFIITWFVECFWHLAKYRLHISHRCRLKEWHFKNNSEDVLNAWSRCPLLCWNFLKMLTFLCQVLIFVYIKRLHLFIALLFLFLLFIHKLQLDIFVSCMPCIILVHFYSLIPPSTLSMMHFFSLFIYLFIYTDRQIDTQTYCPFYFKLSVYFNVCHKGLDYV